MTNYDLSKPYIQYCEAILNHSIPSSNAVYLTCKRFKSWFDRDDIYFDYDDVDKKIRFVSKMRHSTGIHNGKRFRLLPWQQFAFAGIFGWKYVSNNYRVTKNVLMFISRKNGKMLDLNTPIITPTGKYTTMGELKLGDFVMGPDGKPTKITWLSPIKTPKNTYNVHFSNGEIITACGEHNWYVYDRHSSKKHKVLTTEELIERGIKLTNKNGYSESQFAVPVTKALEFEEKELPIDPYILGLWLGDGNSHKSEFTVSTNDIRMYDPVVEQYGDYHIRELKGNTLSLQYTAPRGEGGSKLFKQLKGLNLLHNKHIPDIYLQASINQRLSLLQGLMDTDGCVLVNKKTKSIHCEFDNKNPQIIEGVEYLLNSLGIKYCKRITHPTCNGKICEAIRLTFVATKELPCFRLPRKYDKLPETHKNRRHDYITITDIVPAPPVPMRCITVDNESHCYLCGKKNVTTHNTALAAAIALVLATIDNEPGAEIDFVANSAQQARIGFEHTNNFAESLDPNRMLYKPYRDTIKIPHTKSKIQVLCSDSMSLDGYNSSCFIIDEMHAQKDWNLYNVMKSSQGMRTQPLAIVITTAGFLLDGYPLFEMRKTCMDILNGVKADDSQFSLLYELDKGDNYEDENNWIKCCPSLDQTVTREYMRDQVTTAKNIPAQETGVKTKNFNIFCQSKSVWIPDTYIKQCTSPVNLEDFRGCECWVGIDLSSVSDMSSIGVMIPYDGKFYFKTYSFLPESALEESINKELYKYWKSTGELIVTEGNCIDYDFIFGKLKEIHSICPINSVYFDPYNSTQFNIKCTDEGFNMIPFNQNLGNFNRGTKQMEVILRTNKAVLDNNRINIWTFGNVVLRFDYNGNCKPDKTINENKIDPIISIVEALGGWLNDGGDLSSYDITIV